MKNSDLSDLLKYPDQFLTKSETRIIKDDETSTVGVVTLDHRQFVIKEHKMRSLFIGLKYCFFPSRALKCWKNSHLLSSLSIPTPKPFGYTEKSKGLFKKHSYFIYEYVQGIDGYMWFKEKGEIDESLAKEIVALIHQLKENKITYGDFKISNLIISEGKPWLIDIHAIKKHRWMWNFQRQFQRNVQRFMRCWKRYPREEELFIELLRSYHIDSP